MNPGNMQCVQLYSLTVINEPKELRLVGGLTKCEGRVEVKYQGEWGTACDDEWDVNSTEVVCKQLGCSNSRGKKHPPFVYSFGPGSGKIWLDNVKCTGSESLVWECPRSVWGMNNCDHREDIGVICEGEAEKVRLVGGRTPCEGRVEVKYQGEWGTVCNDHWDTANTAVVCRQLGCNDLRGENQSLKGSSFGAGSEKIWLDDVNCTGAESALWECPHGRWGLHDCNHSKDTGVICKDPIITSVDPLVSCVIVAKSLSIVIVGLFLTVSFLLVIKNEGDTAEEECFMMRSQDAEEELNKKPL